MNCEPISERYMPHKIEQPSVAVKALGDTELFQWVERIASAPNVGLLDEYKGYLRECAMRMKERGNWLKGAVEAMNAVLESYDILGTDPDSGEYYGTVKESAYAGIKEALKKMKRPE